MAKLTVNKKTDFLEGFRLTLANAHDHIKAAEACEAISLGLANSHLILASEEAVKAALYYQLYFDPDSKNEIDDFDKYNYHKHKHQKIKRQEDIGLQFAAIVNAMRAPLEELDETASLDEKRAKYEQGLDDAISIGEKILADDNFIDTNQAWWDEADKNKNLGLYVDLLKDKGIWIGPFSITAEQYQKSKSIVSTFVLRISTTEEVYQNPKTIAAYNALKEMAQRNKDKEE